MEGDGQKAQPGAGTTARIGDVLGGKYVITGQIGAGGMGVVLAADDRDLQRTVAVKTLLPHLARDGEATARFLREARAAAAIQSEHVVRILAIDRLADGAPYIVMEHLRGSDLAALLRERGPLEADDALDYVLQACEALAEAHALGVVHRDLKPQNLFLSRRADGSPLVKVLDFGISKAAPAGATDSWTGTTTVLGSPLYMSPEQIRSSRDVDARSDVWSLGVVLFELLTGEPIFRAATATALYAMILSEPARPLSVVRPGFPPDLERVILRCVEKDPARRFADIGQFARALTSIAPERAQRSIGRIERIVEVVAATDRASDVPARIADATAAAAVPQRSDPMMGYAPTAQRSDPMMGYAPTLPGAPPGVSAPPGAAGAAAPRAVPWWPFAIAGVVVTILGVAALAAFAWIRTKDDAVTPASVSSVAAVVVPAGSASAPWVAGSASARPPTAYYAKPPPSAAAPATSASAPAPSGLTAKDLDLSDRRAGADEIDVNQRRPHDAYDRSYGFVVSGKAGSKEAGVLQSACTLMQVAGATPHERELGVECLRALRLQSFGRK